MTPAERIQVEKERILAETGRYIPPYRMASLMKAVAKITDILVKADTNICYEECKLVLAVVASTIGIVTEEDNNDDEFY